jgi:hypothetical protein
MYMQSSCGMVAQTRRHWKSSKECDLYRRHGADTIETIVFRHVTGGESPCELKQIAAEHFRADPYRRRTYFTTHVAEPR